MDETITLDDSEDEMDGGEWKPSTKNKFNFNNIPTDGEKFAFEFSIQLVSDLGRMFSDKTRKIANMLLEAKRENEKVTKLMKSYEAFVLLKPVPVSLSDIGVINNDRIARLKQWTDEEDKYLAKANIARYGVTRLNFPVKARQMSPSIAKRISKYWRIALPTYLKDVKTKFTARKSTRPIEYDAPRPTENDAQPKKKRIRKNEFVSNFIYKRKPKKKSIPTEPESNKPITRQKTVADIVNKTRKKPGPKPKNLQITKVASPGTTSTKNPEPPMNLDNSLEGEEIEGYTLCHIDGDIVPVRRSKRTSMAVEKKKPVEESEAKLLNENNKHQSDDESGDESDDALVIDEEKENENTNDNITENEDTNDSLKEDEVSNDDETENEERNDNEKENDNPELVETSLDEPAICEEKRTIVPTNKKGKIIPTEEEMESLKKSYASFIEDVVDQFRIENKTEEIGDKTEEKQLEIISENIGTSETCNIYIKENYEPDVNASENIIKDDEKVTSSKGLIPIKTENKNSVKIECSVKSEMAELPRKIITRSSAVKSENTTNAKPIKEESNAEEMIAMPTKKCFEDLIESLPKDDKPLDNVLAEVAETNTRIFDGKIDNSEETLKISGTKIESDDECNRPSNETQQYFHTPSRQRNRNLHLSDDEMESPPNEDNLQTTQKPKARPGRRVTRIRSRSGSDDDKDQMQSKKVNKKDDGSGSGSENPSQIKKYKEKLHETSVPKVPRDPRIRARMKSIDLRTFRNPAVFDTKKIEKRKSSLDADLLYRTPLFDLHSDSEAKNNNYHNNYNRVVLKKIPKISKQVEQPKINQTNTKVILTQLEKQLAEEQEMMKQMQIRQNMVNLGVPIGSIPCDMEISPVQGNQFSPQGNSLSPLGSLVIDTSESSNSPSYQNRIARVTPQPTPPNEYISSLQELNTKTKPIDQFPQPSKTPNQSYPYLQPSKEASLNLESLYPHSSQVPTLKPGFQHLQHSGDTSHNLIKQHPHPSSVPASTLSSIFQQHSQDALLNPNEQYQHPSLVPVPNPSSIYLQHSQDSLLYPKQHHTLPSPVPAPNPSSIYLQHSKESSLYPNKQLSLPSPVLAPNPSSMYLQHSIDTPLNTNPHPSPVPAPNPSLKYIQHSKDNPINPIKQNAHPSPFPTTNLNSKYTPPNKQNPNLLYCQPSKGKPPKHNQPKASTSSNIRPLLQQIPTITPYTSRQAAQSASTVIDEPSLLKAMDSVCDSQLANFYQAMESIKSRQAESNTVRKELKKDYESPVNIRTPKLVGEIKPWIDEPSNWNKNRHYSDDELEEEEIRDVSYDQDSRRSSRKERESDKRQPWESRPNYKERKRFNFNISPWEPWYDPSSSASDHRSHSYHYEPSNRNRAYYDRDNFRGQYWRK